MGHRKSKSSFDSISDTFVIDGHDTVVHETDLRAIDKKSKENANII